MIIDLSQPEHLAGLIVGCVLVFGVLVVAVIERMRANRNRMQGERDVELCELKFTAANQALEQNLAQVVRDYHHVSAALKSETARVLELERRCSKESARREEQQRSFEKELKYTQEAKAALVKEFEVLAGRVLESKQEQHAKEAKDSWNMLMTPFREQLKMFNERLVENHKVDSAQRNQLLGQIVELQKQSQEIGKEATNLTNTLKGNNKAQGIWGELVLERVLEQSGLVKGREFDVQVSISSSERKRFQPDAIIYLPEGREVVVDSKVSLLSYGRIVNAENEGDRAVYEKQLLESVKAHIKNLAGKDYSQLSSDSSLDFVLMFIPLEAAFVHVVQSAPSLLSDAYNNRIAIVSPSSLLVVLKTIESLWSRQRQDMNVKKIVEEAGKLYDQFVLFAESLEDVGANLAKAGQSYDVAKKRLVTGRGNLVRRVEVLRSLGAKTSKELPKGFVDVEHAMNAGAGLDVNSLADSELDGAALKGEL